MKMKELSYLDRPYEKLENYGPKVLSDSELLAIILKTGTKEKTVLEIAQELMAKDIDNEGITFLSQLSIEELTKINGIGRVKAIQLKAVCELVIRGAKRPVLKEKIKTPEQLSLVFMGELRYKKQEVVKTAIFDSQNRIITAVTNSIGGINSNSIEIREILAEPIKSSAAKIALIHNHPSGDVTPSKSDIAFTKKVDEACKVFGIELIDHIIIGNGNFSSLKRLELF